MSFCSVGTGDNRVLREAKVLILTNEVCNQAKWYRGRVTDLMVCAGLPEGKIDSCQVNYQMINQVS